MLTTIVAFAAAPFLGVLLSALLVTPFFGEFSGWGLYFGFGLLLAYPCAFLVGLPLYLLARRLLGPLRFWHFAVGGVVASLPALYFALAPETSSYFQRTWLLNTVLSLVAGIGSGVALWFVLRVMRSNRSLQRTTFGIR